jgi:hypothetical protein
MVKSTARVRVYYVLPCCLLLLNLANAMVGYQCERIVDPWLRTTVVIGLVLFGGSLVAFLVAPGLERLVRWLQRTSRAQAGGVGEAVFLLGLGAAIFALYYLQTTRGIEVLVPEAWRLPGD